MQRAAEPSKKPLVERLFEPVDIASVVFFRVAFGALMLIEVLVYFGHNWVREDYIEPVYHFAYLGFGWVHPWPGDWMIAHFALLGVLAVMIMVGLWYRVATTLFFLGLTYVFLLDSSRYINHVYLMILFAFLLIFVPANRRFSVDVLRKPELRSETVPAWSLWILRAQMGVVYLFGGLAKINRDWFRGEPLRAWLAARTDFPIIGGLFTQSWVATAFAYGSLLLDLLALPLLLIRKTRPYVFAALVLFHLMNARLFDIGIFPWLALAATTLFFEPDWPRRLAGQRRRFKRTPKSKRQPEAASAGLSRAQRATAGLLAAYLLIQVVLPLRHLMYPGDASWTEEGQRFAWQMMLRQKKQLTKFFVTPAGSSEPQEVDLSEYLTSWQAGPMGIHPYLILEFAHHLAEVYRAEDGEPPEVHAHVIATLNGRPPQLLVDPRVDLAAQELGRSTNDWIVPLGDADLWIPPPGSDSPNINEYILETA